MNRGRIAGVVYLVFFLTAIAGALVMPATAKDILAHQASFRLGYALTLISTACYVALVGLFYLLFRHVSRTIALLAAFFGLVGCAVAAVQSVFQLGPTLVLGDSPTSSAFNVRGLPRGSPADAMAAREGVNSQRWKEQAA